MNTKRIKQGGYCFEGYVIEKDQTLAVEYDHAKVINSVFVNSLTETTLDIEHKDKNKVVISTLFNRVKVTGQARFDLPVLERIDEGDWLEIKASERILVSIEYHGI